MHITKSYRSGIGHIDLVDDDKFRATFYRGRGRVAQSFHATMQEARFALRQMAKLVAP